MESVLYDAAGHRRSPATLPGYHRGRPPRNKGLQYPADPPTVEEIVAVMRAAGNGADGARLRALIVILWRAGLRIGEALDLAETILAQVAEPCWSGKARAVAVARSAWTGGPGISFKLGSRFELACRSARFSASSTVRRLAGIGSSPRRASSCGGPLPLPGCADGSRRTSYVTRTRSR